MGIICKNCKIENFCGCDNCKRMNKGKVQWSWYNELFEICGKCGAELPYESEVNP